MRKTHRERVYEAVAEAGKNGLTTREIMEKTGLSGAQVRGSIYNCRDICVAYRVGNACVYVIKGEGMPLRSEQMRIKDEMLEILKNGGILDQYWRGEKSDIDDYGDSYLPKAMEQLWKKGHPILRRKNKETGLWEFYYLKEYEQQV